MHNVRNKIWIVTECYKNGELVKKMLKIIYQVVIKPIILYAAEIWEKGNASETTKTIKYNLFYKFKINLFGKRKLLKLVINMKLYLFC